ncbi:DEAD/DEAH box helicase [Halobaculum sp. MBLA0143]|uniref:DEAD/DEAH box helicase n=1 Tax=Halobaculum sp. MBLA0143 TaxID=3079933 RepID=UPI003524AADE
MRYFDRASDETRYPDGVADLLDAMLSNRQLFDSDDQGDRPYVADAVKYEHERQDRRASSPYDGDDEFVQRVADIFEFDPLDFQVDSWQTVNRLHRQAKRRGSSTAAVLSAPTGFGKTEAFLGALFQHLVDDRQDSVAMVYPRRALLQDQLERVLEYVHRIGEQTGTDLSVGLYTGGQPYRNDKVGQRDYVERSAGGPDRLALTNCWCGDDGDPNAFEVTRDGRGYRLQCEADPSHRFDHRQVVLPRSDVVHDSRPDILLTTLESLESFALKPNYDLVDHLDTIVLDEVHLYTQLRGAHAARIVRNVDSVSESPLRWIGSSATIDDPEQFGRRIFGIDDDDRIETVEPPDSDYDDSHDDSVHYYFLSAAEDVPVSSMAIQQSMLLGHTLTGPDADGSESKVLSFIDSISQINQKSAQFRKADADRGLWRYHFGGDGEENWPAVASSFGRSFVDRPLNTTRVYADEGFDAGEAADSNLLFSTSFLEVGIDIGDIGVVTQYRTPWDLSSFNQRAGRAGRQRGDDAHVVVLLSNLTDDANVFYRAERFLGSDIRTPLKIDNPVVEWIHSTLRLYSECASAVEAEYRGGFDSKRDEHLEFLDRFLREELGYDAVYEFVTDPQTFFDEWFDRSVDVPGEPALSEHVAGGLSAAVEATAEEVDAELAELTEHFDRDGDTIVRGSEAVREYTFRVRDELRDLIDSLRGQIQGYVDRIESAGESPPGDPEELEAELEALREETAAATRGSWTPTESVSEFESVVDRLFGVSGRMRPIQRAADRADDGAVPRVNAGRLDEVDDVLERLRDLQSDGRLERYFDQRTQLFYLGEAVDELEAYIDLSEQPYKSLYGVKHLLRCSYYVSRFWEAAGESVDEEIWFVPPDYYGSAGRFVTVFGDQNAVDGSQESIDSILSTYVPYRSEYRSDQGTLRAFLPRTEVTDDGTVQFTLTESVDGRQEDGVLVPDEIRLTEYEDLAGDEAQNVVQYCPVCLTHTDGDCLRHDTYEEGKIHAEPEVATQLRDRHVDEQVGNLALADVSPTVTLEGVTLEITPADPIQVDGEWVYRFASERDERRIESPERPLGFHLNTRGLVFDLGPFLDSLGDGVRAAVEQYQPEDADVPFEYLVHHTAAHFLLQLVADVSSVNTTSLLYGFDEAEREVYVFERTEGGQGVVDLAFEEIDRDPGSVLESLLRVGYNPQVEAERLWTSEAFVDRLSPDIAESGVRAAVDATLDTPFEYVVDQVTQEVLAGVDRCRQLGRDSETLSTTTALRIKHTVAEAQLGGEREYPESAVDTLVDDSVDHDRLETLFHSPDVDDCVETLQLSGCIAGVEQGDGLSYVVAERLRNHLLRSVDASATVETMFGLETTPAAEFDDTSIFLDF